MILLIDNYDSFTYNLYQMLSLYGDEVLVKRNDEISLDEIEAMVPKAIVISPGPGRPEQAGLTMQIIEHFGKKIPMLGVCLGHQAIGAVHGAKVTYAPKIYHGKTSSILTQGESIFSKLPRVITVGRYHSLILEKKSLPECFTVLAHTEDGEVMAIQHKEYPLYGLQFHPESILTQYGKEMVEAFLEVANDEK
ncbi:aminodeoxychorismate/anthranilate synthase component II [Clostridia bacterium]|nr:aminodeoxychorismate/anthranilate synthase component II [Clostridia bacterium]